MKGLFKDYALENGVPSEQKYLLDAILLDYFKDYQINLTLSEEEILESISPHFEKLKLAARRFYLSHRFKSDIEQHEKEEQIEFEKLPSARLIRIFSNYEANTGVSIHHPIFSDYLENYDDTLTLSDQEIIQDVNFRFQKLKSEEELGTIGLNKLKELELRKREEEEELELEKLTLELDKLDSRLAQVFLEYCTQVADGTDGYEDEYEEKISSSRMTELFSAYTAGVMNPSILSDIEIHQGFDSYIEELGFEDFRLVCFNDWMGHYRREKWKDNYLSERAKLDNKKNLDIF